MSFKNLARVLPKKFKSEIILAEMKYKHLFFFLQKLDESSLQDIFSDNFLNSCRSIKYLIEDYNNPIIKEIEYSISSPEKLFTYLRDKIGGKEKEFILALVTDSQNKVIEQKIIQEGTVNYCNIYPREILKFILENNGVGLILAHNHPSGKCEPSNDDINLTNNLEKILKEIDIKLLDHIVITQENAFSIKANRIIIN